MENKSLPLSTSVLIFLSLNLLISVIMWLNFLTAREHFPAWFGPVFLMVVGLLICIICFYIWLNLRWTAKLAGSCWLAFGIVWGAVRTKGFRKGLVHFEVE